MSDARIGLVLGAGGVAGVAFHSGVLAALAEELGWDPRRAELVVGTSAGSVTAAGLRAGVSAADLLARATSGSLSAEGAAIMSRSDAAVTTRLSPPPARLPTGWPAAPAVVLAAGRRPWRVRPGAVVAGLMPPGAVPTAAIAEGVEALFPAGWPGRATWICAVRLDTGRLTVFGRTGAPPAPMGQAVAASCAIPGYFAPVPIDGARYVDGGAHSLTNLAKVRSEGLDLVVVSAPMARAGARRPGLGAVARDAMRLQLALEAGRVRRGGTPVIAFAPTPEDQRAMGRNPMDPACQAPVAEQARRSTLRRLERPDVRRRLAPLLHAGSER
ncbi:MAG TPA: patatin-like phospholipase family protein [Acidimicrobiales bacterium]|nr:patatin-like phospholipase family protein [Acidimicrobiales bacterium]